MASDFIPIVYFITKFYQTEVDFKNFKELPIEKLISLSKKVYKMQEIMEYNLSSENKKISKLEKYQRTIQYLNVPRIRLDLKTFDERIAFLIMTIDPNLIMFKEFLKLELISMSEINVIDSVDEKKQLLKRRKQIISRYESTVREKLGFFDTKLLKYEEMFFKNFYNDKELITEVGINKYDNLMSKSKLLINFNSISDERYEELIFISQTWLSLIPKDHNYKVAAYSIVSQSKLLGLTTLAEQLALFILLVDSDLDMLRIYEEESKIKNTEQRIMEQFGYFNMDLLVLEKKFHARFCPSKALSIWSKNIKTLKN